jgi:osmotically-inducible protein OsmY
MRLTSEDLRLRVLNAIHWDLAIPRDRLNVDVENGWVTVSGTVDLPYQRTCAESDARSVPGVVGVTNLIRLAEVRAANPQPEEMAQSHH